MKFFCLRTLITTGAIAIGVVSITQQPGWTQYNRGFYCDMSTGKPITMYRNSSGEREPWIRWTSNFFQNSGYDNFTRCREVSRRLEIYRQQRRLRFITVGMMNRQRVVCTASQINGRCERLIFTLKPGQDAVATLDNLLAWRKGETGTPSLYESASSPYIDVSSRLDSDSDTPSVVSPTNSQHEPQSPTSNPDREL
ncbi:hypothetical protein CLI64_18445 [Nostoc sp. CENA543]|uniref:COP23 domain-containing protein n=1 Tax=Nostoc sp. CENA543 TaxID=1869241 RepID=UPI000CA0E2D9|nr:COP23 domain-containing protein [Nostoc sp. CENA543]AUT04415.1 hypothetical protein CLI64_18445 [Nostoc sp. CENA543]